MQSLDQTQLATLRERLRGPSVLPNESGYDLARSVHNAMIDKRPALIIQAANVADVRATVQFAREQELPLAIRGGGHNVAGLGTCDDGIVLDLGHMRGVRVDPQARRAWVEGGATWGDVDHATHAFGLATTGGIISTTGVGGLTLGGGIGHLSRRFGLSIDNLVAADVVTADGQFIHASEHEHPELFWALRGGGGNFGVVTAFTFQLHPVDTVFGGFIAYPIERAAEVLASYRAFIADAPREVNAFFGFHLAPPADFIPESARLKPVVLIVVCAIGPLDAAEQAVRPLREFGPPLLDMLHPLPYPVLNSLFDAFLPHGLFQYMKAGFDAALTDAAIAVHETYGPEVPSVPSIVHLYPIGGAVAEKQPADTAFSYRDAAFIHTILAAETDPVALPAAMQWVRDYWSALQPHAMKATYVNFLMQDEGDDQVRQTYRDNFTRLRQIKAQYDPTNLFRVNHNIPPAAS
ncbi:FAD-binding oxidoreductase [Thermorudis peleae]|uniref:FAD-binding oxidoreductase n=1 Tax=Thermorudis peleae TaxID=1382356 RepID=UPI0005719CC0|nr:FAD-binding oxidoreductase [Thermorudis peleae]